MKSGGTAPYPPVHAAHRLADDKLQMPHAQVLGEQEALGLVPILIGGFRKPSAFRSTASRICPSRPRPEQ